MKRIIIVIFCCFGALQLTAMNQGDEPHCRFNNNKQQDDQDIRLLVEYKVLRKALELSNGKIITNEACKLLCAIGLELWIIKGREWIEQKTNTADELLYNRLRNKTKAEKNVIAQEVISQLIEISPLFIVEGDK